MGSVNVNRRVITIFVLWIVLLGCGATATATQVPRSPQGVGSSPPAGSSAPASSPPASSAPEATSVTKKPAAKPAQRAFATGGLGVSRGDWERAHGKPNRQGSGLFNYENDEYIVQFSYVNDAPVGNVSSINDQLNETGDLSLSDARKRAALLLPKDAKRLSTEKNDGRQVDVYMSPSLTQRFKKGEFDPWQGEKPGTFIVSYTLVDGKVIGFTVSLGNNP